MFAAGTAIRCDALNAVDARESPTLHPLTTSSGCGYEIHVRGYLTTAE